MATAEALSSPSKTLPLLPPAPDFHARFSREAYHRLFEIGVLDPASRVELIDGEIFMMLPIGPPQGGYTSRLAEFFVRCIPSSLQCRIQMPIIASDHSEPEPDIAIVKRRDDDYMKQHPSPSDIVLLVEVSDSSLHFDMGRKLKLYASSGIAEYWVVDIEHKSIHTHCSPAASEYADSKTATVGELVTPIAARSCQLAVDWLFR